MDFRILGPLEVADGGSTLQLGGVRQRALLGLLLLNANQTVSSDRLIEELWGKQPPESGRGALQVRVSQLRKALGPAGGQLVTEPPGYVLRVDPEQLDLHRFERLVAGAEAAPRDVAAATLREALGLWRGAPLADLAYESFAQPAIRRLEELRLAALEKRIEAELVVGRHGDLVGELEALAAAHPLRERLHVQLMLALYRCGRQADALAAYQSARRELVDHLGIEPAPPLRELEQAILRQDPALEFAPAATPGGGPLQATKALDDAEPRHNLPAAASSFVGRDRELAELRELLSQARAVTLTGAGGVGKTRLALRVARDLLDRFGEGTWFLDLAPLADPALVASKLASVLGVQEEPGRSLPESLIAALAERELLLILDNCEHLIGEIANLADRILKGCPRVFVLSTSREPLAIAGEHLYRVPSLSIPSPGEDDPNRLLATEAVRLLVERAAAQRHGFALEREDPATVGRLCRRLDGIPLAIELAAARLRSLSVRELEERLDHRFQVLTGGSRTALPRQQTLEALIDWSYDLLNPGEQQMLDRLSVFAGGFDLGAAEAVASGLELSSFAVLDRITALVDKSLVQADDTGTVRYRLLESVQAYAAGKLLGRGETSARAVRASHRGHYLALAERAAPHLVGHGQLEWLDRLELELDDLRAAVSDCLLDPDPAVGLRMSSALCYFWLYREPKAEGAEAICAALDRSEAREQTLIRGRALVAAAILLTNIVGEHDAAAARAEEGLNIGNAFGDEQLRAGALHILGIVNAQQGNVDAHFELSGRGLIAARKQEDPHMTGQLLMSRASSPRMAPVDRLRAIEECLTLFRQAGNQVLYVRNLSNLGYADMETGETDAARVRLEEAVRLVREIGDKRGLCLYTCNLGFALHLEGADVDARVMFDESLRIAKRNGDLGMQAYGQLGLALIAARAGEARAAATLHGAADAIHEKLGTCVEGVESRLRDADISRLRAELGDGAFEAAYGLGRLREVGNVTSFA